MVYKQRTNLQPHSSLASTRQTTKGGIRPVANNTLQMY
jgi:hypothetical protein